MLRMERLKNFIAAFCLVIDIVLSADTGYNIVVKGVANASNPAIVAEVDVTDNSQKIIGAYFLDAKGLVYSATSGGSKGVIQYTLMQTSGKPSVPMSYQYLFNNELAKMKTEKGVAWFTPENLKYQMQLLEYQCNSGNKPASSSSGLSVAANSISQSAQLATSPAPGSLPYGLKLVSDASKFSLNQVRVAAAANRIIGVSTGLGYQVCVDSSGAFSNFQIPNNLGVGAAPLRWVSTNASSDLIVDGNGDLFLFKLAIDSNGGGYVASLASSESNKLSLRDAKSATALAASKALTVFQNQSRNLLMLAKVASSQIATGANKMADKCLRVYNLSSQAQTAPLYFNDSIQVRDFATTDAYFYAANSSENNTNAVIAYIDSKLGHVYLNTWAYFFNIISGAQASPAPLITATTPNQFIRVAMRGRSANNYYLAVLDNKNLYLKSPSESKVVVVPFVALGQALGGNGVISDVDVDNFGNIHLIINQKYYVAPFGALIKAGGR